MTGRTDSVDTASDRIRPLAALRAVRALLRDPDDTARVFDVIDALSGRTRGRLFERFRQSPTGARLLAERPDLRATLSDLPSLRGLPEGTLGHTYADFMTREQISADGLVDASRADRDADAATPEAQRWLGDRLRDMHDLWHVVTGYERDLVGEAALITFTFAQTRNPGIGLIALATYGKAGDLPGARRVIREAYRRGRRAAWLPGEDWEALLERPLHEVRETLAVGAPPTYEPVRSPGAPALAS